MFRRIKTLTLSFGLMVIASSAVAVSVHASQLHASTSNSTTITGQQTSQHKFQITSFGPSVLCSVASFEGTAPVTAQEITVTAIYTSCQAFGQQATVNMNGCKYAMTGAGEFGWTATVDITGCTSGKQIEITTAICQIKVPAQGKIGGHVTFWNTAGSPPDAYAESTLTGISYQVSGVVCGHTTGVTTSDAIYQGTGLVKAYSDEGTILSSHNGHSYNKLLDWTRVGLTVT